MAYQPGLVCTWTINDISHTRRPRAVQRFNPEDLWAFYPIPSIGMVRQEEDSTKFCMDVCDMLIMLLRVCQPVLGIWIKHSHDIGGVIDRVWLACLLSWNGSVHFLLRYRL